MNKYIKGTFLLSLGVLITKVIGAIYRIVLSNILTSEGVGIYQMVFPIYTLFLVFITGGISIYVSKQVASFGRYTSKIAIVVKSGIVVSVVMGILSGLFLFLFSRIFASLQGNSNATLGYVVISASIVFSGVTSVFRGYFQGKSNMVPTAISQVFEQTCKVCFGILFSILLIKYGIIYGMVGAFLGILFSEFLCFILMLIWYLFKGNKNATKTDSINIYIFLRNVLPISLGVIMLPLMQVVDSFLVINTLSGSGYSFTDATRMYGIYSGMILPIINFPLIFCTALCTASLPLFSENAKKKKDYSKDFNNMLNVIWCISLACMVGIFVLSKQIITVFFPVIEIENFNMSIMLLKLCSLAIFPMCIVQICSTLLNANGKYKIPVISLLIAICLRVGIVYLLLNVAEINILGMGIANIVCFSICALIQIYYAKKICNIGIGIKNTLYPIFCVGIMALIVYALSNLIVINQMLSLLLATFIGGIIYLLLLFIGGIFDIRFLSKKLFKS